MYSTTISTVPIWNSPAETTRSAEIYECTAQANQFKHPFTNPKTIPVERGRRPGLSPVLSIGRKMRIPGAKPMYLMKPVA